MKTTSVHAFITLRSEGPPCQKTCRRSRERHGFETEEPSGKDNELEVMR